MAQQQMVRQAPLWTASCSVPWLWALSLLFLGTQPCCRSCCSNLFNRMRCRRPQLLPVRLPWLPSCKPCPKLGPPRAIRSLAMQVPSRTALASPMLACAPLLLQVPPTPPVDPENEEFVIFVRSKKVGLKRYRNYHLSPAGAAERSRDALPTTACSFASPPLCRSCPSGCR